jgi:hypothetical protein
MGFNGKFFCDGVVGLMGINGKKWYLVPQVWKSVVNWYCVGSIPPGSIPILKYLCRDTPCCV